MENLETPTGTIARFYIRKDINNGWEVIERFATMIGGESKVISTHETSRQAEKAMQILISE